MTDSPVWHRSSRCGTSTCVEVAKVGEAVLLRDSKNPEAAPLRIGAQDWAIFLEGVAAGDYPT